MHQSGTTFCLIKLQAPLVRKQLLHFVEKMLSYRRPPIGQHAWPVAVLSNGTNNRTHSYPSLRHQNHDSLLYRSRFFFQAKLQALKPVNNLSAVHCISYRISTVTTTQIISFSASKTPLAGDPTWIFHTYIDAFRVNPLEPNYRCRSCRLAQNS